MREKKSYISQNEAKRQAQLDNLKKSHRRISRKQTKFILDVKNVDIRYFAKNNYYLKSGKTINIEPFQLEFIDPIYPPGEKRTYQQAIISMCKKSGKSEIASLIICHHLYFEPDCPSPEVIGVARDKKQSKIIFSRVAKAIRRNPRLRELTKIYKEIIEVPSRDATYTVLASGIDSSEGRDPSLVVCDEMGVASWELFSSLLSGQTARAGHGENVFALILGTAGHDLNSAFYKYLKRCERGLEGVFCHIDHGNPAPWVSEGWLRKQKRILPDQEYKRYHNNLWTPNIGSFVTGEQIEAIIDDFLQPALIGQSPNKYFAGVDLGVKHDESVITVVHREKDKIILDYQMAFIGSPKDPVQLQLVKEQIEACNIRFHPRFLIDAWQGIYMIQQLRSQGLRIEEWRPRTLNAMVKTLYSIIVEGKLKIWRLQPLIDQLCSVVVTKKISGLRLDPKSGGLDDRVFSLSLAIFACTSAPGFSYSRSGKPGVVVGRKTYDSKAGVAVGPSPYFPGGKPDFHNSKNFMPQPSGSKYKDPTLPGGTGGYERPGKAWPPPSKIDYDE